MSLVGSRCLKGGSALLALALVACGGGGGSGGGGGGGSSAPAGGGQPATQVLAGTSVRLDSPPSGITATVGDGTLMSDVRLVGSATGDLTPLAGRTIYVIVEDPDQLFDATPAVSFQGVATVAIDLRGRTQSGTGTRRGQLNVHVCLDPQCSVRLANSPLAVPYEVVVAKAIDLSSTTVDVQRTFGDPTVQQVVTVRLLSPSASLDVLAPPFDPLAPSPIRVGTQSFNGATWSLPLTFVPALPGVYTAAIRLRTAVVPSGSGASQRVEETLTVTYTVADKPSVDVAFVPDELEIRRTVGDTSLQVEDLIVLVKPGATLTWEGIEYDDHPPAAAGHPQVNAWFSMFPSVSAILCRVTSSSTECLPAGEYTAAVRYRLDKNGANQTVRLPVKMTLVR